MRITNNISNISILCFGGFDLMNRLLPVYLIYTTSNKPQTRNELENLQRKTLFGENKNIQLPTVSVKNK